MASLDTRAFFDVLASLLLGHVRGVGGKANQMAVMPRFMPNPGVSKQGRKTQFFKQVHHGPRRAE